MTDTEAVRRVEESSLDGLADMSVDEVYAHIDHLTENRPGPLDLYQRWERQQWSASALDFSIDRMHWESFDQGTRDELTYTLSAFFVGEQYVTDTLSPLVHAAPDEESRWFLSTQLVDEARHSYFFSRVFTEVLDRRGGTPDVLGYARAWSEGEVYRKIFGEVLTDATEAVREDPADPGKWIRGITIYHLMIEGILALTAQRQLLEVLRNFGVLPAFRTGFTAVTRDESRHVSYGVWAVANAVAAGYEPEVRAAVDEALSPCLNLFANSEYKIVVPENIPEEARYDWEREWSFAISSLTKRLRAGGLDPSYVEGVETRGWQIVWEAVDRYEARHGEHPVRSRKREEKVG